MFMGSSKRADQQVYARLIDNVKFASKGNEVSMSLAIAQTDVDFLIGLLAKKEGGGGGRNPPRFGQRLLNLPPP